MEKSHSREIQFIRIGLAAVFLANALTAIFNSGEFTELLEGSFVGAIIPAAIALKLIIVNDSLLAVLILLSRKWHWQIFAWAMVWIMIVLVVLGKPIEILEESGFLFMALALFFHARKMRKNN